MKRLKRSVGLKFLSLFALCTIVIGTSLMLAGTKNALVTGAGLLLAVLIYVLAMRRILEPLGHLTRATEDRLSGVEGKELAAFFFGPPREDEIGRLTDAFARMDKTLRRQFRQLRTLVDVDAALSTHLDMRGVLHEVGRGGRAILEAKNAWVFSLKGEREFVQEWHLPADEPRFIIPLTDQCRIYFKKIMGSAHPTVTKIGDFMPEVAVRIPYSATMYAVGIRLNAGARPAGAAVFRVEQAPTAYELSLLEALGEQAAVALENSRLYFDLRKMYLQIIASLTAAVEAKDNYTANHGGRLAEYSAALALTMGLSRADVEAIRHASLLHDVGKIGTRDSILLKPGPLDQDEYGEIKQHPVIGAEILKPTSVPAAAPPVPGGSVITDPTSFLAEVAHLVRHHHEWFDGRGYPDGLAGEDIPLGARIIAVVDAFEAMTSDRPYRKAMGREEALAEIRRCAGTQFDPRVVEAFFALLALRDYEWPEVERVHWAL